MMPQQPVFPANNQPHGLIPLQQYFFMLILEITKKFITTRSISDANAVNKMFRQLLINNLVMSLTLGLLQFVALLVNAVACLTFLMTVLIKLIIAQIVDNPF